MKSQSNNSRTLTKKAHSCKYKKAYNILMDNWDWIDEYQRPVIDRRLKRLGL